MYSLFHFIIKRTNSLRSTSTLMSILVFARISSFGCLSFNTQNFTGVSDLNASYKENWESCIDETVKYLGHAVGALYVSEYFPKESQEEVI